MQNIDASLGVPGEGMTRRASMLFRREESPGASIIFSHITGVAPWRKRRRAAFRPFQKLARRRQIL
jgi:hypothetical protein